MFFASLRTTAAVAFVLLLLTITYLLLGIGEAYESSGMVEVGGWAGILTAAAAWYASFAAVINSTFGRTVLPVMPLGD
jgi:succinate-acetate transporter protein